MNLVSEIYPNAVLIAGFSKDGDICLSSEDIPNPALLEPALKTFTSSTIDDYLLENGAFLPIRKE